MADIQPFVCTRPPQNLASEIAALPYDVFNRSEAAQEIAKHPLSFLRIDKTAALFDETVSEYDEQVYACAAEIFGEDMLAGRFVTDEKPGYMLYRLQKDGHSQLGVACIIAVDDYHKAVLKRHENTRLFKLEDRIKHIEALKAQTGPVLVAYRPQASIDAALEEVTSDQPPIYDFTSPDAVTHTLWQVTDETLVERISAGFAALDTLYIADGHHRAAAACAKDTFAKDTSAYFMIVAFASNQLKVMDYNRVVFDKNGHSTTQLLDKISTSFGIRKLGDRPQKPSKRGEFAMYLDGLWYLLSADEALRDQDAVKGLDVSYLQEHLLGPILGVDDPRSSKRIAYVGGVRGLDELKRRADQARPQNGHVDSAGGGVAFALYPCTLDELFAVADCGQLMPPKSTWFEPKPRSGLFMHRI